MTARNRRGHGEGSVYFDQRSGLWAASLDVGRDEAGRRRRVYRRAKTKREVLEKLTQLRSGYSSGLPIADQRTTV